MKKQQDWEKEFDKMFQDKFRSIFGFSKFSMIVLTSICIIGLLVVWRVETTRLQKFNQEMVNYQ